MSQALEQWRARAIWIVSRADQDYPRRLNGRLRENAPAILYGCGDVGLLDSGGLAVVSSRHVDEARIGYTLGIGQLAARAERTIISGGAKGIDQVAMRGALEAGGRATGVLVDGLERSAMQRDHRNLLLEGRLVMISPYDPGAGFNVGNSMQRNKLIYALSDAALVVNSDEGGTWAGVVEQMEKLHLVPVYVRSSGATSAGLIAIIAKGALVWPEPQGPYGLLTTLDAKLPETPAEAEPSTNNPGTTLLRLLREPMREAEIAVVAGIPKTTLRSLLKELVVEGSIEKSSRSALYRLASPSLFGQAKLIDAITDLGSGFEGTCIWRSIPINLSALSAFFDCCHCGLMINFRKSARPAPCPGTASSRAPSRS